MGWPEIDKEDSKDSVQIIVEPYLDAGSVKTADLVIIANFESPKEINFNFPLVKYKQVEKKEGEDLERPIEVSLTKFFLKISIFTLFIFEESTSTSLRHGSSY